MYPWHWEKTNKPDVDPGAAKSRKIDRSSVNPGSEVPNGTTHDAHRISQPDAVNDAAGPKLYLQTDRLGSAATGTSSENGVMVPIIYTRRSILTLRLISMVELIDQRSIPFVLTKARSATVAV